MKETGLRPDQKGRLEEGSVGRSGGNRSQWGRGREKEDCELGAPVGDSPNDHQSHHGESQSLTVLGVTPGCWTVGQSSGQQVRWLWHDGVGAKGSCFSPTGTEAIHWTVNIKVAQKVRGKKNCKSSC